MKHILDDSYISHFWSTFWSPIYAFYMSFRSSGSQQSNASNGAQFRVETRKLQPLQVNHSELKEAFCKVLRNHPFVAKWFGSLFAQCCGIPPKVSRYMRHTRSWAPQDESRLRSAARLAFCCEVISQLFLYVCEISQTSFSLAKWFLKPPEVCYRHWEIFSIRFLLSKSQNTPCKPPITWFLSF